MSPKFGTSGLRGLVSKLTDELITDYTRAFLTTCNTGGNILLGRDLRPSSAPLLKTVSEAARAIGIDVIDCGTVPTPALALAATKANAGAIMITGMEGQDSVVGYEANGGFLLGFTAKTPAGSLAPLLTRDCMLPLVAVLVASAGASVSARLAQEPAVITLADRLQEVSTAHSHTLMTRLIENTAARAAFLAPFGKQAGPPDLTDGLRMTLTDGAILHIRPSGNAPELRLYVEEKDRDRAEELLKAGLVRLHETLNDIADGVRKM